MGTGSFGSGGSGALGRGGSGAAGRSASGGGGAGDFFAWRDKGGAGPPLSAAAALIRERFAQRNVAPFVYRIAVSPQVRGCYEELFRLSVLLGQQRDWRAIQQQYGVDGKAGCLAALARVVVDRHATGGIEAHREIANSAVLDVLLAVVGNDDDLFLGGTSDQIFRKIDQKVFASLSGHFLGSVLNRAVLRELPALQSQEALKVREAAQARADFLIASFERSWLNKADSGKQVTHRDLLRVAQEKQDWFEGKLRQELN